MSEISAWDVWQKIIKNIERDSHNTWMGGRKKPSDSAPVEIRMRLSTREPVGWVTLRFDPDKREILLDAPTSGVPRSSSFEITDGLITLKDRVAGSPEPPESPMTPEQFSKFVLAKYD